MNDVEKRKREKITHRGQITNKQNKYNKSIVHSIGFIRANIMFIIVIMVMKERREVWIIWIIQLFY